MKEQWSFESDDSFLELDIADCTENFRGLGNWEEKWSFESEDSFSEWWIAFCKKDFIDCKELVRMLEEFLDEFELAEDQVDFIVSCEGRSFVDWESWNIDIKFRKHNLI